MINTPYPSTLNTTNTALKAAVIFNYSIAFVKCMAFVAMSFSESLTKHCATLNPSFRFYKYSTSFIDAFPTISAGSILPNNRISFIKRMALLTVCLSSLEASSLIFSVCDWFKMVWIHTATKSTEMIQLKTFRNWSLRQFVRVAMCHYHSSFISKSSVSGSIRTSVPTPTIFSPGYFLPKSLHYGGVVHV